MLARVFAGALALVSLPQSVFGHAAPILTPKAPYQVNGSGLFDAEGKPFLLSGVQMSGLSYAASGETERRAAEALNSLTFRVIRQRWNMNTVRLLVSPWIWKRDGQGYLERVAQAVRSANAEELVVVLAAADDARSGASDDTGLPGPEMADFWAVTAAFFKDNPMLIFSLYERPSPRYVPGNVAGVRQRSDWEFWLKGGTATNGRTVIGMQKLAETIRAAGAQQILAVPSFHDSLDFRNFEPDLRVRDSNVAYEVHPYFDHALTDAQRDANFGILGSSVPVYAGEWGTPFEENSPSCQSVPGSPSQASDAVLQLLVYLSNRSISWTAAGFEPSQLIRDFDTFEPTELDRAWTCGQVLEPQPGIGGLLLLFSTGDPYGFGSIAPDQIANAAGGPASPAVPGQVLSVYGQGLGPLTEVQGTFDESGKLATSVAETQVLFDGVPAPIFSTGYFMLKVQVPFEAAGKTTTQVQAFYRGVPSNRITLAVVEASPGIFTIAGSITDASVLNEDGSKNRQENGAVSGSMVTLYATGFGQTSPAGVTGLAAAFPYPQPLLPVSLSIGGSAAELLYVGGAPGQVGVMQINARVPFSTGNGPRSVPVVVTVNGHRSRSDVRMWLR